MKKSISSLLTVALFVALGVTGSADPQSPPVPPRFVLDPPNLINDFISIGEFETSGATSGAGLLEGWFQNQSMNLMQVTNGVLKGTSTGPDPYFYRNNILGLSPAYKIVEVRARVLAGARTGWQMFWGGVGAPGFSGDSDRRIESFDVQQDSDWHIWQFDFAPATLLTNRLTDFRIDPTGQSGSSFEIDYVRVGNREPLAPTVTSQPTNQIFTLGQTVTFSVSATAPSPLRYQWTSNGTNILGATNATFILPNASLANVGEYTVIVSSANGSVASLAAMLTFPTLPQTPGLAFGLSSRTLGTNRENMETPYYRVGPFGWLGAVINDQHDAFYYPTFTDYNPPGYCRLDAHNAATADFNGDGREDLVITWAISPNTAERQTRSSFMILLNDSTGGLRYAPEMFDSNGPPIRYFAYRTGVADFNRDGRPDIVASSMGMIRRNPNGTYDGFSEPIPLILSGPDGKYFDASANIQGQEKGGLPEGFALGHDLSIGDVNGDGFPDFYTGKCLFLNDGTGRFKNATAQLPIEMRPNDNYLMSSLIGDLNGDGIGDIVAAYADGDGLSRSGYILLSRNGDPSLGNRQIVALPPGRYGAGTTKFNHAVIYDINNDGLPDIVFSVTRLNPYYLGRKLQILINKGDGVFVDETLAHVSFPAYLETAPGEGTLHVVDVNRDGILDLVHSAGQGGPESNAPGLTVYFNDGKGVLHVVDRSFFAWVQRWQVKGNEDSRPWLMGPMSRAYPIDLDGKGGIDFVSSVPWPRSPPNEYALYSILSVAPLTVPTNTTPPQTTIILNFSYDATSSAVRIAWGSLLGKSYTVESSGDLNSWLTLLGPLQGTDAQLSITNKIAGAGSRFFRIKEQ